MRAGIDITSIIYGRGVSRYTTNLVDALSKRSDVSLELYGSSLRQKPVLEQFAQQRHIPRKDCHFQSYPPKALDVLWNTLGQNQIRKVMPGIEVFHSWDWLQPPDKHLPLVSTIHDLAILKFPETAHPDILRMHRKAWHRLKQRKAQIIAISRATKHDILEYLDIPADDVHVIYEALPNDIKVVGDSLSDEQAEQIKLRLKLDRPYILFVGTREPRKNLQRLIEAWQPLAKEVELIIAGEAGWDETSNLKAGVAERVRFLGRVSDQELAVLYSEAELFAYPCLYEGFGLPILEAFYYGTPVVTSGVSSMVEIAGNAAELVDPLSVESITRGLELVLHESGRDQEKRLQRMVVRLHMFSWDKVAEETVRVYQRAIATHE